VLAIARARLRAQGISLDRADLEACYAQAWQGLYTAVLEGNPIESPAAWLVLVTYRRAIDEARSARASADLEASAAATAAERDLAGELDDRARLRELFEALRCRLSPREREAASLCYLQGLSRAEAARRLGIAERRMQKLMDGPGGGAPGLAAKVGELLATIGAGGWCEQQSSLMRAYAFGILDPGGERHAMAVAHTRSCPACRAHVAALRGLASVLPPLPLALPLGDAADRGAGSDRRGGGRRAPGARGVRRVAHKALAAGRGVLGAVRTGVPLPLKLALAGVALIGGGSAYLVVGPSASPAHGGLAQSPPSSSRTAGGRAATQPARAPSRSRAAATLPMGSRSARSRLARSRQGYVGGSGRTRRTAAGGAVRPSISEREFRPERVGGEAARLAPSAAAASQGQEAGPREGEFGIE